MTTTTKTELQFIVDQWKRDRKQHGALAWFETVVLTDSVFFAAKSYGNWIQRAELTIGKNTTVFGFECQTMRETLERLQNTIERELNQKR